MTSRLASHRARFLVALATLLVPRLVAAAPGDPEATPAAATALPPSRWQKPVALEGHLGVGTPLGLVGVALDVTPVRWVSLNLGVGHRTEGTQFAAMTRARFSPTPVTGGFGAGISGGRYTWSTYSFLLGPRSEHASVDREWKTALWGNVDFHFEGRSGGGFQWRIYVGYATLLNPNQSTCSFEAPDGQRLCSERLSNIYVGSAMGYAF